MKASKCLFVLVLLLLSLSFSLMASADTVLIPPVSSIEADTFLNDSSLDEVIISDGTESIGSKAFSGTALQKVTIPASVTLIAEDAFDGCDDLLAFVEKDSYAYDFCVAHDIRVYMPLTVSQQYLSDGVITLPSTTRSGTVFTLDIECLDSWTVETENEPGTETWFRLSATSGTGNSRISLTVSSVPGSYTNLTVRDHFITDLIFTGEHEQLTVPVMIVKNDPFPNTYRNTGDYKEDLLGVALTQVGYQGSNAYGDYDGIVDKGNTPGDHEKYGRYMNISGNPWCASFVSWCAFQANIPKSVLYPTTYAFPGDFSSKVRNGTLRFPYFIGVTDAMAKKHTYLLKAGIFMQRDQYTPRRGELIFFRWPNANSSTAFSHIGIVMDFDGTTITYVDGNGDSTDTVKIRNIEQTDKSIAAYLWLWDQ